MNEISELTNEEVKPSDEIKEKSFIKSPSFLSIIATSLKGNVNSYRHGTFVYVHHRHFVIKERAIEIYERFITTKRATYQIETYPEIDRYGNHFYHVQYGNNHTSSIIDLNNSIVDWDNEKRADMIKAVGEYQKIRELKALQKPSVKQVMFTVALILTGFALCEVYHDIIGDNEAPENEYNVDGDYNENKEINDNSGTNNNNNNHVVVP